MPARINLVPGWQKENNLSRPAINADDRMFAATRSYWSGAVNSSREAARTVRETEAFFLSEYYSTLTNVDGRMLLNRLRKEFGENEL